LQDIICRFVGEFADKLRYRWINELGGDIAVEIHVAFPATDFENAVDIRKSGNKPTQNSEN
jgi:hypothetical protein